MYGPANLHCHNAVSSTILILIIKFLVFTRDSVAPSKGRLPLPKRMNFQKSSKGGGGVIFNPKIYVADFCHYRRCFGHEFQKKIAT